MSAVDDFVAAYDALLDDWPVNVTPVDVPTPFGPTRVNVRTRVGGAASPASRRRGDVDRVDRERRGARPQSPGARGGRHGRRGAQRERRCTAAHGPEPVQWLDAVLDHLEVNASAVVGHSYGAMIALAYALHGSRRVDSLVLLDPTSCFAGMSPRYLLRAVPVLIRPTEKRQRSLIGWETAGAGVDPGGSASPRSGRPPSAAPRSWCPHARSGTRWRG